MTRTTFKILLVCLVAFCGGNALAATLSFSGSPTSIAVGGQTTLSWSSTGATSCTASGAWSGSKAVSASGTVSNLLATGTYTLTCTGTSGSASQAVTVTVTTPTSGAQTYFYFSSAHDALSVLSTAQAKATLAKYTNVIVGIDAGGDTASTDFLSRVQTLRAQGWRLHVYLEGPGGPTGNSWSPDECLRIQNAAKIYVSKPVPVGDHCQDDNADWMKEWNQTGFFKQLQQQLSDLQPLGVESVEVDNLYRAGYGDGLNPLSEFIIRFNNGKAANNPIKLLLKNIGTSAELDALLAASPRTAIAGYMILEEDLKNQWCALQSTGKKYGIVAAFSWSTFDYHAETDSSGKDLVLAGPSQSERQSFSCN